MSLGHRTAHLFFHRCPATWARARCCSQVQIRRFVAVHVNAIQCHSNTSSCRSIIIPDRMNHWAHLPDEIWARIFTDMVQEMLWDELSIFAFASGHFHALYTLRQVCKKFHRLFLKSSELYSALLLDNPLDGPAKQQLDKHIQLHSGAITRLDASCGHSCLEPALLALQKHHCCLKQVYLQSCSRSAVDLLESFSSLHRCMFFNPSRG